MDLLPIYSVPLWQSEYPQFEDHKEMFLNVVKTFREQNPSQKISRSNINGYRSPDTLHTVPELSSLFQYICNMSFKACADLNFNDCNVAITGAWLNINDNRNSMNCEHVHGDVFSGVFYLKSPDKSGELVISNPAINKMWQGCNLTSEKNKFTAESIHFIPEEGNILLFPSYIPHSVRPNNHDDERISISFNVIVFSKNHAENENKIE
jgi:uncharacterized protein (TIGR02466 family)